ncbi:hypothetical protein AM500_17155 [Bacillus sp. FJAT-18017]|uniref:hypothetical protein n=1 Tax=Bacillus sp. FJAT-18017 TaxID=1705566 RepID=UPI0006AE0A6F|nr:hypothetical protein [Bacillus sp. FJAT-18017]ALC91332.1 hypothetical protein AM500_17155 [Bacillus sp. FJAT-18017]
MILIRKLALIALFFALLLSACTQEEKESGDFSGIVNEGSVMNYEYTIEKEGDAFFWKVGYKGERTSFEESSDNKGELDKFMKAVNDGELFFGELVIWTSYFTLVVLLSFYFYWKNKKWLKESGPLIVVVMLGVIGFFLAFDALMDLSHALKDAKFYYSRLTTI